VGAFCEPDLSGNPIDKALNFWPAFGPRCGDQIVANVRLDLHVEGVTQKSRLFELGKNWLAA
jgi:hypothetical protein